MINEIIDIRENSLWGEKIIVIRYVDINGDKWLKTRKYREVEI